MSVDFYVASETWPTPAAMQQCLVQQGFPILLKRFPTAQPDRISADGILAEIDKQEAYLEGGLYPAGKGLSESDAKDRLSDAGMINARLTGFAAEPFRVGPQHYLLSVRIGGRPIEMIATSYVIAGLVNCFGGFGFEPQGDTYGRASFARSLLDQAKMLKEYLGNDPKR